MTVSYGKGDKAAATKLHSLIVRSRGRCERCGDTNYSKLQCAHIIRRRYSSTRTDESAAWALCWTCHDRVDNHPDDFMLLVEQTIGLDAYFALKAKAERPTKVDWQAERARLKALLQELEAA